MNEELPAQPMHARLDVPRTAALLGFMPHDIPILIKKRLLKPLGNPKPNAPKYFATCALLKLALDVSWLNRASEAVAEHWRVKNQRRAGSCAPEEKDGQMHFS